MANPTGRAGKIVTLSGSPPCLRCGPGFSSRSGENQGTGASWASWRTARLLLATSNGEENGRTAHRSASSAEAEAALRFVRQFAVKLKAGLSTDKCLAALTNETRHRRLRRACQDMHAATAKGMPLAQAMRGHRRLFDDCVTGLVERGEQTRKLHVALASVADYLEHRLRLERALRGAVARPLDALSFVLLATFIAAVVYVGINFVVDLSYALLDPRAVKR